MLKLIAGNRDEDLVLKMVKRVDEIRFYHPAAFWLGCILITLGVAAHFPMFMHAAAMGYQMVGMPMDTTMLTGMGMIPLGVLLAWYGLMPRLGMMQLNNQQFRQFRVVDSDKLNKRHWQLVLVLFVAIAVDVMKPATLGFVMPGMIGEYGITKQSASTLALVALTGTTIGSILWGRLSDLMGRRSAILLSALMFMGTAICGAMPEFEWNLVMCFLMGLSAGGLLPIAFILMAEIIPPSHRGWLLVALGGLGTSAGYLLASGSAALLEPLFSWRILWLLGLPTGLLVIFLDRYIPESPRFLQRIGLNREASAIQSYYNNNVTVETEESVTGSTEGFGSFRDAFSSSYRWISIGLVGVGLSWGLVNFGFLLWLPSNLRDMGFDAERSNELLALSGLFAVPGCVLVVWLYHSWSSIKALVLFNVLSGLSLLLFAVLGSLNMNSYYALAIPIILLLISSSGIIAMLIPYATEIYPTELRGTGTGMVAASSKAGGIVAALLGILGVFNELVSSAIFLVFPIAIFSVMLFFAGIDTRKRSLEDIAEEILLRKSNRLS